MATSRNHKSVRNDLIDLAGHGDDIREASDALKAMAHPLRLKILCLVGQHELMAQEIVEAVGTSQSNISQHLAVMRERGLLASRKEANKVFYRIDDPRILKMIGMMREVFCSV
ncbi:MAG: winged helix-turn-helix transcriptional regulator [Burkholderiales bacterium]|nr:winged helix-turn-helix transcriptional regulator [Burkholderiales bacterium]